MFNDFEQREGGGSVVVSGHCLGLFQILGNYTDWWISLWKEDDLHRTSLRSASAVRRLCWWHYYHFFSWLQSCEPDLCPTFTLRAWCFYYAVKMFRLSFLVVKFWFWHLFWCCGTLHVVLIFSTFPVPYIGLRLRIILQCFALCGVGCNVCDICFPVSLQTSVNVLFTCHSQILVFNIRDW